MRPLCSTGSEIHHRFGPIGETLDPEPSWWSSPTVAS